MHKQTTHRRQREMLVLCIVLCLSVALVWALTDVIGK